jgi:hypothetical protein
MSHEISLRCFMSTAVAAAQFEVSALAVNQRLMASFKPDSEDSARYHPLVRSAGVRVMQRWTTRLQH